MAYFFDFSNPFIKLEIEDNILVCYSDNEKIVQINPDSMHSTEVIETYF